MKKTLFIIFIFSYVSFHSNAQTVTDIDGNVYNTVTIGTQKWMQENLKTTHFNNGDEIPTTTLSIYNDTTSVYQWAYNFDTSNVNIYGRLYTWFVVFNTRNVCPVGWHVPDNSDWDTLRNFLGGEFVAGGKMKEMGTAHWFSTDSTVSNSSGFTGLGGGMGRPTMFINLDKIGVFWSATPFGITSTFPRGFNYYLLAHNNDLHQSVSVAHNGQSIRCIKGFATGMKNSSLKKEIEVYPNPATDRIVVSLETNQNYHLSIYDALGRVILQKQLTDKSTPIDISRFPKGNYIIEVIGDNFRAVKQIVKF